MIKKLLSLFLLFACLQSGGIVLYAQETQAVAPQQETKAPVAASEKKEPRDAVADFLANNQTAANPAEAPGGGYWGPMIFLLLVVGILYVLLRYIRRKKTPTLQDVEFMQSLGTLGLAAGSFLEIVEIGPKVYLLGVGANSVNLLMEIEDKELVLELKKRPLAPKHKSFLDVLGNVFEKKGHSVNLSAQKGFMHFLKEQKNRLKKLK